MKFVFDFVMLERKQKQGFEFIHIWPKWKLHVSIYFNANNRVGLPAAVSISASLASLPSLLQCWNGKSAHYSWLCMIFDTILKNEWKESSIKNSYINEDQMFIFVHTNLTSFLKLLFWIEIVMSSISILDYPTADIS